MELRNLRCHPDDGTWALSESHPTPNFTSALDGGPLKHLAWSPTGSDLAVIDAAGRITILSVFASLNKPSLSRNCQVDVADDLHAVVGCFWLNIQPYPPGRPVCQSCSRKNISLTRTTDNTIWSCNQRWTRLPIRDDTFSCARTLSSKSFKVCIRVCNYEWYLEGSLASE